MNKNTFYFITLFMILSLISNLNTGSALEGQQTVVYTVTKSNTTANTWFNANYSSSFKYIVDNNTDFTVTIANGSDMSSELDIAIGNITRESIYDAEAEGNLAIGYWKLPNMFGFIANNSWKDVQADFTEVGFNSSNIFETSGEYLGGLIDVIEFYFEDNYQNTTLVYSIKDALLLSASTEVFGFSLEFTVSSINDNVSYYSVEAPVNFLFFAITIPIVVVVKRFK